MQLRHALAFAILVAGCARPETNGTTQFGGRTMGTTYQVTYAVESRNKVVAKAAEELLAEINRSLSTYDKTSLISAINASTDTGTWHPVDKHFAAVFRRSRMIYEDTGHTFNPAVGPLVNAWGFGPEDHDASPDDKKVRELLKVVQFEAFELQETPPAVKKTIADAKLDFSAIGEGYAIDAIGEMLESNSVRDYLVELGGEVRARGRMWKVGIERPDQDLKVVRITDAGLATSGTTHNFRIENGKRIAHILDPRTGYPAQNSLLSVSVLARDTKTADAYATALMVMGLDEGMRFVEARPELQAYFIAMGLDGKIVEKQTSGFPE
jgi:thiamine biosynthesis lipoprotein